MKRGFSFMASMNRESRQRLDDAKRASIRQTTIQRRGFSVGPAGGFVRENEQQIQAACRQFQIA